jgi:ubiquinone biosynthesis protein UbiJ
MIGPQVLFSRLAQFVSRYYGHPAYQPLWKKADGHVIQMGIAGIGDWRLSIVNGELQVSALKTDTEITPIPPTITITGPLRAFLRLAGTRDLPQAKQLGLCLTGNLTLVLSLAHLFKNPPIDFTEHLAGWLGDNAAHRLTQWGSKFYRRLQQGSQQIADMTAEYLQEEVLLLPTGSEIDEWMAAVDTLRDDVECLAARLQAMQLTAKYAHADSKSSYAT